MAVLVSTLLGELATMALEEDSTFPSGLWSTSELIGYINDIQKDLIVKTQIVKKLSCVSASAGVRLYDDPADSMQIDRVAFANRSLYRTAKGVLDKDDSAWRTKAGRPRQYHQDQLATKKFEVDRAPSAGMVGAGYTVSGSYGVLRQMSGSFTYSASLPATGGGVLRSVSGVRPYVSIMDPPGSGGTPRRMFSGDTNFEVIHTKLPDDVDETTDYLAVPDFCKLYVKWGVLWKMFSKDGETRDLLRAKYCRRRYTTGINLFRKLMGAEPIQDSK